MYCKVIEEKDLIVKCRANTATMRTFRFWLTDRIRRMLLLGFWSSMGPHLLTKSRDHLNNITRANVDYGFT